ncbi:peptidoglycan DD-metalloendopeptidase family protein [Streptomyces sp. LE64]|uniref:peptidoglycan DD-metalloendopeptidase family protein n=1 Tax=Streptomyces sp. LE64 TaxID=3448653 RepID=UPI0040414623
MVTGPPPAPPTGAFGLAGTTDAPGSAGPTHDGRAAGSGDGPAGSPAAAGVPVVAVAWALAPRPRVVRGWEPPPTPYAAGHRGVDLSAAAGAAVRAVAPGRVVHAGPVAGRGVVVVELSGTGTPPLRLTHEPVRPEVRRGDRVAPGDVLGRLEPTGSHCPDPCLHWGLRRERSYLDPLSILAPHLLRGAAPRLLPLAPPVPVASRPAG